MKTAGIAKADYAAATAAQMERDLVTHNRRRAGWAEWSMERFLEGLTLRCIIDPDLSSDDGILDTMDRMHVYRRHVMGERIVPFASPAMELVMKLATRYAKWRGSEERLAIIRAFVWMLGGDDDECLAMIDTARRTGLAMWREDDDLDADNGDGGSFGGSLPRRISLAT